MESFQFIFHSEIAFCTGYVYPLLYTIISYTGIHALCLNLTLHLVYVQIRIFLLRWVEDASKLLLEISLSLQVSTIRLVQSVELQVFGTYAVHRIAWLCSMLLFTFVLPATQFGVLPSISFIIVVHCYV